MKRGLGSDRQAAAQRALPFNVLRRDQLQRLAIEERGVVLRPAALGLLGRPEKLLDRTITMACIAPMACDRGDRLTGPARRALEELSHERVPPGTVGARQEAVGDV